MEKKTLQKYEYLEDASPEVVIKAFWISTALALIFTIPALACSLLFFRQQAK